ncbi:LysR family transcriptional regulator [Hominifimenecus sp. rT4P-3]|uniref:LysR family transcriptional regulator n=1 Tax=Hominifimenecus sp. rT4P-3 TaxID=3242979 RepID=UPI003DA47FB1
MTLKQLSYFQKLAETQNYTQTAKELYISQPSLSYTIKELEKEFPAPLFEKEGNGNRIRLSPSGQIFLKYVQDALQNIEDGKNAVSQYIALEENILNIGYIHTFSLSNIIKLFHEFQAQPCGGMITLRQEISNEDSKLLEQLRLQKLNFAFCLEPTDGISGFPFFQQELFIILSKDHPLAERKSLSFEDIQKEPCVQVGHAHTINRIVDGIFQSHNCTPRVAFEAGNLGVALAYVLGSHCYTIAPQLPTMDFSRLTALSLEGISMCRPIYFAWKTNKKFSKNEQLFFDFVSQSRAS